MLNINNAYDIYNSDSLSLSLSPPPLSSSQNSQIEITIMHICLFTAFINQSLLNNELIQRNQTT